MKKAGENQAGRRNQYSKTLRALEREYVFVHRPFTLSDGPFRLFTARGVFT